MSETSTWKRVEAWDGIVRPGRFGADVSGGAGLVVTPRHDLALAYVIAGERDPAKTIDAFSRHLGIDASMTPKVASRGDLTLVWSGPGQWLALSSQTNLSRRLTETLLGAAAITDQSDGRAVLMLEGARARDVLAKGCPVDLHPRRFLRGDAAITAIAGIGAQLWRPSDRDGFHIVVPRSMAGSFWSWLTHSAAEFGMEVNPA